MPPVMYSHRLKTVLQHTVRDLGLTLAMDDEQTELSLADNEAMLRETASLLGIQVHVQKGERSTSVTFYR